MTTLTAPQSFALLDTEQEEPRAFGGSGPTLGDRLELTWEGLLAAGVAGCPACGGRMERAGDAASCASCGSELS